MSACKGKTISDSWREPENCSGGHTSINGLRACSLSDDEAMSKEYVPESAVVCADRGALAWLVVDRGMDRWGLMPSTATRACVKPKNECSEAGHFAPTWDLLKEQIARFGKLAFEQMKREERA